MSDAILAGAFLGMLMASIFVGVGLIILLPYVNPKSPTIQSLANRGGNSTRFVMIVLAFYPAWAAVGAATGLILVAIERGAPGDGLGSPNLAFTAALVGFAIIVAVPLACLPSRRCRLAYPRNRPAITSTSSSSGTRSCSSVSRSRTVTAWSWAVSPSTVIQKGVPISSWRR